MHVAEGVGDSGVGVVGDPRVVDGDPGEVRQDGGGVPRLAPAPAVATQVGERVGRGRVQQCSVPSTRRPVSSTCTSSAVTICSRTAAMNSSTSSPAAVPSETAVPSSSAIARAARFFNWGVPACGEYWPTYRYTMIAGTRRPYCTGARHPVERGRGGDGPAAAATRDDPALGDLHRDLGQVEHLPAHHTASSAATRSAPQSRSRSARAG